MTDEAVPNVLGLIADLHISYDLTSKSTIFQACQNRPDDSWLLISSGKLEMSSSRTLYSFVLEVVIEPRTSCSGVLSSITAPPCLPDL